MVAFSSRLALKDLLENESRHNGQRQRVYRAIKEWPGTVGPSREDISKATGLRLGSVCGRIHQLLKDGVIQLGPMKEQAVVLGHPVQVQTLQALEYRAAEPMQNPQTLLF